jgi:hypothetical protein
VAYGDQGAHLIRFTRKVKLACVTTARRRVLYGTLDWTIILIRERTQRLDAASSN